MDADTILNCCLQTALTRAAAWHPAKIRRARTSLIRGSLALREILQRVLRTAIHSNFEMQLWLVAIIRAHFGNLAAGSHLLTFADQPLAVMCVSAEHSIAVLDNDQFAVPQQTITAVHHLAVRRGNYCLSCAAPDINAFSGRVIGLESADHSAISRPHPV